ncbi:hypothetical protein [Miltoncostaea marina]|uniref:hypothetical protein n=1 Tax=Miltoncostaea marina TaxID=2843215 RepID=UPI001C3D0CE0|nr:hypothetical protein [Miltoncostaea marina]
MSREALVEIRERNALGIRHYEALEALHVPWDELVGGSRVEGELGRLARSGGRVAVVGPSGTGKSSVLAAVLGQLAPGVPDHLVPVRIPMSVVERDVIDSGDFARHIVRQVIDWAAPDMPSRREREALEARIADLSRRSRRPRRPGFALNVPLSLVSPRLGTLTAGLARDIQAASGEWETRVLAGEPWRALADLVEVVRGRGLEPFFVLDDTDVWLRSVYAGEAEAIVRGFVANVRTMITELDCGLALQVHTEYLEYPAMAETARRLTLLELPRLPDPPAGLARILGRRLEVAGVPGGVADAFAPEALEALGDVYGAAGDLRLVLAVADEAVGEALQDEGAALVGPPALRAAQAKRTHLLG